MIVDEPLATRPEGADGTGNAVLGWPAGPADGADRADLVLVQRCAWTLVWIAVLAGAVNYWSAWSAGWWAAALVPAMVLVSLIGALLVWYAPHPLSTSMQRFGMYSGLAVAAITQGTAVAQRTYYTTDSAAFNQVATRLFLDGHNPYTSTMAAAGRLLHPAASYWTYQVDGAHTLKVSYPAGSFLLQAPLMALGVNHMASDWIDLAAWLVTAVILFAVLSPVVRWVAPMLLLTGVFVGPFANGGTDALFVPFLVVAVWRWDRYPDRSMFRLPAWVGPVCLGIACSIKQSPWFCVPFLLVGVACEARRRGHAARAVALRYGATVICAFLVVNAPFILWSPAAWLRGIFLPMVDPLVADGQGAVSLALHGLTGGVVLPLMSAAAGAALVAVLAAFAIWEPRLKRVWLFLVPLVLFLPDRSLANYLIDFAPAALVAAISVTSVPPAIAGGGVSGLRRRWRWAAVGAPTTAAAALLIVAFTSAPLELTVGRIMTNGIATPDSGLSFRTVEVTVHNTADRPLTPHFIISAGGGHPNAFWQATVVRGSDPVGAGATTDFRLAPTRYVSTPVHGQWWLVAAYTTSPNALSTSSLQYWRLGKPPP